MMLDVHQSISAPKFSRILSAMDCYMSNYYLYKSLVTMITLNDKINQPLVEKKNQKK